MAERRFSARVERVLRAPRQLVWALVADTNRANRALGLAPGRYEWREADGERRYVATAKEMGQTLVWYEPPYEWSEGHFVEAARRFLEGPARTGGFRVRLSDVPGGTKLEAENHFSGDGAVMAMIGPIIRRRSEAALARYVEAVEQALARAPRDAPPGEAAVAEPSFEPSVVRARRTLAAGYDPIVSGERGDTDLQELRHRADALARDAAVDRGLVDRLVQTLTERPDEEVAQLRPFEVARVWHADRRAVLRLFLHATRAGLVDLRWQLNCPVCRVSAGVASSLAEVGRAVHCGACNVDYGLDFAKHVEAVFVANAALRKVTPAVYCMSTPAMRPHVLAQLRVAPGAEREVPLDAPPGELLVRTLESRARGEATRGERPAVLRVDVRAGVVEIVAEGAAEAGAPTRLVARNDAGAPRTLLVERAGWSADAVLGSVVATFPDFLDLFATEAPATGVDLAVGHLALLFSDLTGSTALYERVGDARAFALVEEHFRLMGAAVEAAGGAVVKTMGDAVMASFPGPADAVRAAIAMVAANEARHAGEGLGVKLGVHAGPCLAVRANDRLDFFGTTVNMAARLQAQARAGEVVLTEELSAHPAVAPLLEGRARRTFEAHLKGIASARRLVGVTLV
jgi:class 3 adenylate cyclase